MIETQIIDRLFLELSQVTKATTTKELALRARIDAIEQAHAADKDIRVVLRFLESLFDASNGQTATRLVLVDDKGRDLGGWSKPAVLSRFKAVAREGQ